MKKTIVSIMAALVAVAFIAGCFTSATAKTKKTNPDGTVTESYVSIVGTGDKASEVAAEGLFADGTDEDLGSGVKKANASQQSTGIGETLTGMGSLMTGMAQFMMSAKTAGIVSPASASPETAPEASETGSTAPASMSVPVARLATEASIAAASNLALQITEAKKSGKPLVVIAGSPGCNFCTAFDGILNADAAFKARTDIVVYRETSAWGSNQALGWTGGGAAPIMRVTQWDSDGKVICDKKVNRPKTVADIDAALSACIAP